MFKKQITINFQYILFVLFFFSVLVGSLFFLYTQQQQIAELQSNLNDMKTSLTELGKIHKDLIKLVAEKDVIIAEKDATILDLLTKLNNNTTETAPVNPYVLSPDDELMIQAGVNITNMLFDIC